MGYKKGDLCPKCESGILVVGGEVTVSGEDGDEWSRKIILRCPNCDQRPLSVELEGLVRNREHVAPKVDFVRFEEMCELLLKFLKESDGWLLLDAIVSQCFTGKKGKDGRLFLSDREDWNTVKGIVVYFELDGRLESRPHNGNPELREYKWKIP